MLIQLLARPIEVELFQPLVFLLLVANVFTDHNLVETDRETKYPLAQKLSPVKFRLRPRKFRAIEMALLPLIKPTTLDTENFGGMLMHM